MWGRRPKTRAGARVVAGSRENLVAEGRRRSAPARGRPFAKGYAIFARSRFASGIDGPSPLQETSLKASALALALFALPLVGCSTSADMLEGSGSGSRRSEGNQYSSTQDSDVTLKGEQGETMGGAGASTDDGAVAPSADDNAEGDTPTPPGMISDDMSVGDTFAATTLARARQWVDVGMPYCGGSNGGTDYICGGTCRRTGNDASPEWDPYRTDCSGFVSWSWGLPSPGRTTTNLAPFNKDITTVINVDDLKPGDALNNSQHIILFGGWVNSAHTQARLLEEYTCGAVAVDRIRNVSKVNATQLNTPSGTFNAIRLDSRPN